MATLNLGPWLCREWIFKTESSFPSFLERAMRAWSSKYSSECAGKSRVVSGSLITTMWLGVGLNPDKSDTVVSPGLPHLSDGGEQGHGIEVVFLGAAEVVCGNAERAKTNGSKLMNSDLREQGTRLSQVRKQRTAQANDKEILKDLPISANRCCFSEIPVL